MLAFISCVNDEWMADKYDLTVQWEPVFEGPLIYGDLSIEDMLTRFDTSGYLIEDSTHFLYFIFDTSETVYANEYLDISNQRFIQVFFQSEVDIPGSSLGNIGDDTTFVQAKNYEFARMGDERLDSIRMKGGEIVIYVTSTIKHTGTLTIYSDQIELNGQQYRQTIDISDPSGNFSTTLRVPLAGSSLYLDNSNPDTTFLEMIFEFTLINSGADILASEIVHITKAFEDLDYQAVYGYAGVYDSLIIDKDLIEFSSTPEDFRGRIQLADPQLHLKVDNSFGVPFGIELLDLEARFKDASMTPITLDPDVNPIIINAPTIDQIGQKIFSQTAIDRNNSNINQIASTDLTGIQFSVNALGNPTGFMNNFILDTSHLDVNIEVVIPMHLRAEGLELADTFDFKIGGEEGFGRENIKSFMFQLETENRLPLEVSIQVYLMDGNHNKLDSLFNEQNWNILPSGVVDDDGKVIMTTYKKVVVTLTESQIDNVFITERIMIKTLVETTDQGIRDIKFYSTNSLGFKLGARAEVSVTSDENN
ncbi:MAG: hypothetical protein AMS23_08690 [Bacteroides sp. SM1_62]|nr:MAG: hypothetical protein AMS23_08690 [Bacteroides sp. SM1_62]